MISIKTRLLNYLDVNKGITIQQLETHRLMQRDYRVLKGTIKFKPDYDDAWLFILAKEATIVFDIGCNIGQTSLLILHPGHIRQIILVDPQPSALSRAALNLIYNGWGHIARFICAFVSDTPDQQVDFYSLLGGAASSMYASHAVTASKLNKKISVTTTTIDQLVEIYDCQPDFVKIDTEGAERLVLQGGIELAKKHSTRFFVEMHSSVDLPMRQNAQAIIDWCSQVNYRAWYLKEKIELTSPEMIAERGRCHLLLLPSQADFPESLLPIQQGDSLNSSGVRNVPEKN